MYCYEFNLTAVLSGVGTSKFRAEFYILDATHEIDQPQRASSDCEVIVIELIVNNRSNAGLSQWVRLVWWYYTYVTSTGGFWMAKQASGRFNLLL